MNSFLCILGDVEALSSILRIIRNSSVYMREMAIWNARDCKYLNLKNEVMESPGGYRPLMCVLGTTWTKVEHVHFNLATS